MGHGRTQKTRNLCKSQQAANGRQRPLGPVFISVYPCPILRRSEVARSFHFLPLKFTKRSNLLEEPQRTQRAPRGLSGPKRVSPFRITPVFVSCPSRSWRPWRFNTIPFGGMRLLAIPGSHNHCNCCGHRGPFLQKSPR